MTQRLTEYDADSHAVGGVLCQLKKWLEYYKFSTGPVEKPVEMWKTFFPQVIRLPVWIKLLYGTIDSLITF